MIIDAISGVGSGSGTQIVQKPTVTVGTYTYDGTAQGPTITGLDTQNTIVTNATATNAGTYTLTIALKNSAKMVWNDMTTADLVYTYTISKATLTVPTVTDTTKTYNGSAQSPTITGFDSTTMTKTGDSATDAGNYTITFGLVDSTNYEWNTTNTVNWSIAKADQTITLSSNSVTLDSEHLTATVTVSGAQGAISVTSSASSVATASVSGSTITISNVNETTGSATITVSVAGTTNYNPATDSTISVSAQFADFLTDWLTAGGLNPASYADLDAVLADEVAIRKLFTIHASVDVLVSEVANIESTDLTKIFNNDYVAKWVNLRDYALDTLYANSTIAGYMDTADKYFYGEWALMPQVPTMTSNTAPYGEASGSSVYNSGYTYYGAFNNSSGHWCPLESEQNSWVSYSFTSNVKIAHIEVVISGGFSTNRSIKIQAKNSNNEWEDITDNVSISARTNDSAPYDTYKVNATKVISASACRLIYDGVAVISGASNYCIVENLQFYAWGAKGNVPIMTSNTAPYGTASASSYYPNPGYDEPYNAFDGKYTTNGWLPSTASAGEWLKYKFVNPVCARKICITLKTIGSYASPTLKIQGSNDDSTWTDLCSPTAVTSTSTGYTTTFISLNNNNYYLYYRLYYTTAVHAGDGRNFIATKVLQYYGREMKVSVPTMTSDTAPYGEAFAKDYYTSGYEAWHAFDGNNGGESGQKWNSKTSSADNYLGYKFTDRICIKKVWFLPTYRPVGHQQVKEFKIQGSVDGTTWIDLSPVITLNDQAYDEGYSVNLNNSTEYQYYRIYLISSYITNNYSINELQFYGFDYSEYDWDSVKPRHYIYDHGLELEEVTGWKQGSGYYEKLPDSLLISKTQSGANNSAFYNQYDIDLSTYSILRLKLGNRFKSTDNNSEIAIATRANMFVSNVAVKAFSSSEFPNNIYMDVSSLNDSYVIKWEYSGNGTVNESTITEWWLE